MGVGLVQIALLCAIISVCAACTCSPINDPTRFCNKDIIIRGKAYNRTEIDADPDKEFDFNKKYLYTIKVDKVIARTAYGSQHIITQDCGGDIVVLKTSAIASLCGTYIPLHTDLVLFGYKYRGALWTNMCLPNGAWEDFGSQDGEVLSGGLDELCSDNNLP